MTPVLVLCMGNDFRSRFSEALLSDLSGNVGAMASEAP